jgi:uncharacterized membrane protein
MTTVSQRLESLRSAMPRAGEINVGDTERLVSALAGGLLTAWGLSRRSVPGLLVAGLGGALGYRAVTGHCDLYAKLGIDTAGAGRHVGNLGVRIDEEIVVSEPPGQVYAICRNFDNLPRVLSHVERVEVLDATRSRWTVKGPVGLRVTWDAELINDEPGKVIAWRTTESPLVTHAGSVTFDAVANGTRVRVSLQYDPPAGRIGHAVAALISQDAASVLRHDLAEFRRALEGGRLAA